METFEKNSVEYISGTENAIIADIIAELHRYTVDDSLTKCVPFMYDKDKLPKALVSEYPQPTTEVEMASVAEGYIRQDGTRNIYFTDKDGGIHYPHTIHLASLVSLLAATEALAGDKPYNRHKAGEIAERAEKLRQETYDAIASQLPEKNGVRGYDFTFNELDDKPTLMHGGSIKSWCRKDGTEVDFLTDTQHLDRTVLIATGIGKDGEKVTFDLREYDHEALLHVLAYLVRNKEYDEEFININ